MSRRGPERYSLPQAIGSLTRQPALRIAEAAVDMAALRSKSSMPRFGVSIDPSGMVSIDHVADANVREMVAAIDRTTNADWLREELEAEWQSRNRTSSTRRHVVRGFRKSVA